MYPIEKCFDFKVVFRFFRYHYLFQAMYDDGLFEKFERNTTLLTNRIKAVFAHLKAQFCHPSLGTKININLQNPNDPIPCCGKKPDGTDRIAPQHLVEEILEEDSSTHLVAHFKTTGTLCCICLGRCCLGLETRVIIKISKNPCYPINVD